MGVTLPRRKERIFPPPYLFILSQKGEKTGGYRPITKMLPEFFFFKKETPKLFFARNSLSSRPLPLLPRESSLDFCDCSIGGKKGLRRRRHSRGAPKPRKRRRRDGLTSPRPFFKALLRHKTRSSSAHGILPPPHPPLKPPDVKK